MDDVSEACRRGAAILAEAPEPSDDAAAAEFLSIARDARRESGSTIRDAAEDSDDADLEEMSRLLDSFPQLIGSWTVSEVAWRGRATVVRLDELAAAGGMPECGAGAWRLQS